MEEWDATIVGARYVEMQVPPSCLCGLFTPNCLDWMVSYIACCKILSVSVFELPIPGDKCPFHAAGTLSLWSHSAAFKQRARPSLENDNFPRFGENKETP